jgi:hypothetical protein
LDGPSPDGLSLGDLLAEIASRQLNTLPPEELVARDERTIDAMLEAGNEELESELAELVKALGEVEQNTTAVLRSELRSVQADLLQRFDVQASELREAAVPAKEALREDMRRTLAAIRAANPDSGVGELSPFYGRRDEVRDKIAVVRSPVYRMCEASAAVASLLLIIAVLDAIAAPFGPLERGNLHELAVVVWRVAMAATTLVYLGSVTSLLTTPEFNQFIDPTKVPPADDARANIE